MPDLSYIAFRYALPFIFAVWALLVSWKVSPRHGIPVVLVGCALVCLWSNYQFGARHALARDVADVLLESRGVTVDALRERLGDRVSSETEPYVPKERPNRETFAFKFTSLSMLRVWATYDTVTRVIEEARLVYFASNDVDPVTLDGLGGTPRPPGRYVIPALVGLPAWYAAYRGRAERMSIRMAQFASAGIAVVCALVYCVWFPTVGFVLHFAFAALLG